MARRCRKHPVCWLCVIALAVILGPFVVAMCDQSLPRATAEWIQAQVSTPLTQPTDPIADTSLALIIGFAKQQVRQSSVLADIAFGLVFCGTLTATVIATLQPGRTDEDEQKGTVPKDFYQKATLSNITQDMQKPQGRLWSTALGLASVLLVVSMYTFWLYRSWQPWVIAKDNPVASPVMQYSAERRLRIAWALVPNVGFVLAAMVPSMSDVAGYDTVLTAVHNVSAPLSMLFLMIMETVQLGFGENAFHYFFSHEPTPLYGPLTKYQRMRVCLVVEAWISGIIFVGVSFLHFFEFMLSAVMMRRSPFSQGAGLPRFSLLCCLRISCRGAPQQFAGLCTRKKQALLGGAHIILWRGRSQSLHGGPSYLLFSQCHHLRCQPGNWHHTGILFAGCSCP